MIRSQHHSTTTATTPPSPSPPSLTTTSSTTSKDHASNTQQLSWEFLRKQARQLESEIENKLSAYAKLTSGYGRERGGAGVSGITGLSAEAMEAEIDELIKKLTLVVNSMAELLDRPSSAPASSSMMHMLQRHRDILYDYSKEFKKTKSNIQAARDHADLLRSVRDEISLHKSGTSSETDYFLNERARIESSHHITDMVIEQAYSTREEIGRQRSILFKANRRMAGVATTYSSYLMTTVMFQRPSFISYDDISPFIPPVDLHPALSIMDIKDWTYPNFVQHIIISNSPVDKFRVFNCLAKGYMESKERENVEK
ncbi:10570_t:CDS:2 [Paraglomus occultum]|uniref:10570_t:CDS:1 n=1 Tax=Paraglomus occultum TaxID=144539 RepID=A0A9N9AKN4_9GLOM|nr:10570_t:CDS:2 [Paraglomus occultum]